MPKINDFNPEYEPKSETGANMRLAVLQSELEQFRQSMNEWIMFLNRHMKETRQAVIELENKVAEIERNLRTRI